MATKTMTTKSIINDARVNDFAIPSTFGYAYDKASKNLTMKVGVRNLCANMQKDEAAFDSWAIALKYNLHDFIDTITIDWERDIKEGEEGCLHFNRFVYRLTKFVQTFDWAKSAKEIPAIPLQLFCNVSNESNVSNNENDKKSKAAKNSRPAKDSEGELECRYVLEHSGEYDVMDHQFPVGLFHDKVSGTTHYTTGGKSAIDIWAIKDDCLKIFELKKVDNKPLGIISELLFYTNVLEDILSERIKFESNETTLYAIKKNVRGFGSFHKAYAEKRIKRIEAILLADNLHTLIDKGLIGFINESARLKAKNIVFMHKNVK